LTPTVDRPYANILIVKLSAIGDVVHALPVAYALKRCFPAARLTWVAERPACELLADNPCIDEVVVFDRAALKKTAGWRCVPGFIRQLRARRFDLALDLQGLFKSAAIAGLSGARRRYVYCNARELSGIVSRRVRGPHHKGHVVEQYLDVVRALGCAADEVVFPVRITAAESAAAEAVARGAGLDLAKRYVVLAPGANWPNKRWPPLRFAALADRLRQEGVTPVLCGGTGDVPLAARIAAAAARPPVDLTGRTSLKELAHIVQKARALVGGDTGPLHLAAALGTPAVALYGPTDPGRNGPYGRGHKVLVTDQACAGCWRRACPRGADCLAGISVADVYQAVRGVLHAD